ncbi:hypothetical protein COHA_003620 [Chlorella ohadii]|uniref:Uncharacterized protein n=1 Tax=Chlorella ohadii TaxID=2649997 RepID=A0AAD5H392_9CHLO|nr:hypothetical protein COHA_003620 [Chlorella ohadii]
MGLFRLHRQSCDSPITSDMSLDQAVAALLDLLAATAEPGFRWGPEELCAACQWGHTLQQLVDTPAGAVAVGQRLQALRPQLPASLQAGLAAVAAHPLRALLERLLRRRPADQEPERWLEAVLAAYIGTVVLPSQASPVAAAAAERHLLAALGTLQQAAAAQRLMHAAAQQAAAAAARQLRWSSYSDAAAAAERSALLAEALQHLTSPASLEAAAAAQLLAQRAQQLAALPPPADPLQGQDQRPQPTALEGLLRSLPSQLELKLLCYVALLPSWEAMLARLAGLAAPTAQQRVGSSSGSSSSGSPDAAQQAVQLLCAACKERPDAVLALHPALPAEVCRISFRFAAAYAPLLASHIAAALDNTRSAAAAARWRVAHATKHADHTSDYLQAKLHGLPGSDAGSGADPAPVLLCA